MTDARTSTTPLAEASAPEGSYRGPAHAAPYPVSRLAPAFRTLDLAAEVQAAETLLNARANAKLALIAEQIQALRDSARAVLREAAAEQALHRARCAFQRRPGQVYHLYRDPDGSTWFSMLAPTDWRGQPPAVFAGSFRLEADYSWTQVAAAD